MATVEHSNDGTDLRAASQHNGHMGNDDQSKEPDQMITAPEPVENKPPQEPAGPIDSQTNTDKQRDAPKSVSKARSSSLSHTESREGRHRHKHHKHHKHKRRSSRSRSRSRSTDRGRHHHKHKHRSKSRSRSRSRHRHSHKSRHHKSRSRSRSRSHSRKEHRHRHRSRSESPKRHHHHKSKRSHSSRSRSRSPTEKSRPHSTSVRDQDPQPSSHIEGITRTDSGQGLVVKLKVRHPFQSPLPSPPVTTDGLIPQRASYLEDVQHSQGASPLVMSPRKVVHHEKTLVTLTHPLPVSPLKAQALREVPDDAAVGDAHRVPATPVTVPILGPLVFGTARAQGMRPYMEDRHTVILDYLPNDDGITRSFAGVYDGHNGTLAADHAADRLHDILAAQPAVLIQEEESMAAALVHSFETTDKEILTRCKVEGVKGGATGVVIVRIGDMLYAAHVGDSRAVLCRCGEALRLTEDHKPNLPTERKRVEGLGGRVDFARCWRVIVDPGNGRPASGLAVSRAFGDPDFKEPLHLVTASPDVMSERLLPGDTFIIVASDGLWDVLSDTEACDLVSAHIERAMNCGNPPEPLLLANTAAQMLVETSLQAGTMDNVTALVALLKWT